MMALKRCKRRRRAKTRRALTLLELPDWSFAGVPLQQHCHCKSAKAKSRAFLACDWLNMVSEVALRSERLDVEAVQGRGKGRIKARASVLALGTGHAGLQLAQSVASKCDAS